MGGGGGEVNESASIGTPEVLVYSNSTLTAVRQVDPLEGRGDSTPSPADLPRCSSPHAGTKCTQSVDNHGAV